MNLAVLSGNVVADPELRYTPSGTPVANFRMATNNGKDKPSDFHNITVWGDDSESMGRAGFVANYLKKGSKVAVQGKIQTRSYEAKDGSKRYVTDIVAFQVENLSPRERDSDD